MFFLFPERFVHLSTTVDFGKLVTENISFIPSFSSPYFFCIQTEEGSRAGIWRKSILSLSKDLRDGVQECDRNGGEEDVGDHVDDRGGHGEGRQDVRRVRWLRRVVLRPCCCPLGLLEYFIG